MIDVTKQGPVDCKSCHGRGWRSIYHNDTEECELCDGSGKIVGDIKLTHNEMMCAIFDTFGPGPVGPCDIFLILTAHDKWSNI